ncbi:MAG: hypothetical protein AAFP82_09260 [Bacteroidota bacterium]
MKRILRDNTDVPYGATQGFADDSFYIHLTNGQRYLVREGYFLTWSDDEDLYIEERRSNFKKNAADRIDNASGFFGTIGAILGNLAENSMESSTSDTVEIEWEEIRDIDQV